MKKIKIVSAILYIVFISLLFPKFANSQLLSSSERGQFLNNTSADLNLQVGTSFTTGFGSDSFFTHSIAPSINWQASDQLTVQAGTMFSSSSFSGQQQSILFQGAESGNEYDLFQDNLFSSRTYAFGYYEMNENLTLMGGGYIESSNANINTQMNPQAFNFDAKGMMMGFDYKINDNMSIGAEFNFRSGYSPYSSRFNPYSSPGFNQSPFNTRRGW